LWRAHVSFLTQQELAEQLGVKASTVERWRRQRRGPRWTYKGKTPISHIDDWRDWLHAGGFKPRHNRKPQRSQHSHISESRPTTPA
jgi:hypothetical protein